MVNSMSAIRTTKNVFQIESSSDTIIENHDRANAQIIGYVRIDREKERPKLVSRYGEIDWSGLILD